MFSSIPNTISENRPVPSVFHSEAARRVGEFHRSLAGYRPTPLHDLTVLAQAAGVAKVYMKDEGLRWNLNAFKVLGASYAVARLLAKHLKFSEQTPSLVQLAEAAYAQGMEITLITATDGNHGRAVAWVAEQLGMQAVVYLPAGAAPSRLEAIRSHGATAEIFPGNYDQAVRFAAEQADYHGWFLVQDTAFPSYEEIPAWIMQGYSTIAAEVHEELSNLGASPSHIFLQAGVGSFAASQIGYWQTVDASAAAPHFVIIEPENAACFYLSAAAADGSRHAVEGDLSTIMAGLSCGESNPLAWPIIRDYATAFVRVSDPVAAYGMRILGNPISGSPMMAGESGAVGAGLLALLGDPVYAAQRRALGLGPASVVLLINTEGATDPDHYLEVVWKGKHPVQ